MKTLVTQTVKKFKFLHLQNPTIRIIFHSQSITLIKILHVCVTNCLTVRLFTYEIFKHKLIAHNRMCQKFSNNIINDHSFWLKFSFSTSIIIILHSYNNVTIWSNGNILKLNEIFYPQLQLILQKGEFQMFPECF